MNHPAADSPFVPRQLPIYAAAILCAFIALFFGWRSFWFLTDDAYIAFRYVSNSQEGYGYVWNPPPFAPVEGYTSFLWILLLDFVWTLFGALPPDSSNWISLAFAIGTLALSIRMFFDLEAPKEHIRYRPVFFVLFLSLILTNRTFLAWTSSGLETALFNFLSLFWVYAGITFAQKKTAGWGALFATTASALSLTRPDGLLHVLACGCLGLGLICVNRRLALSVLGPLLIVAIHLLWRHSAYGFWLPNTYYAKHVAAWPSMGSRYMLSFIIEYFLWIWIGLAVAWSLKLFRTAERASLTFRYWVDRPGTVVYFALLGVVGLHVAYYTLSVGGDHFEYRVYSHLVPLIALSGVWLAAQLFPERARAAVALLGLWLVLSLPVQWVHRAQSAKLVTRKETSRMIVPVAKLFPWPLSPYVEFFDEIQKTMINHAVCMRHQEHKVFWQYQLARYPAERMVSEIPGYPVYITRQVGVPAWILARINIVDAAGLNDLVIARNPVKPGKKRVMAHDRTSPPGYLDCFKPNVTLTPPFVQITPRPVPLGEKDIAKCETLYLLTMRAITPSSPPKEELGRYLAMDRRSRL